MRRSARVAMAVLVVTCASPVAARRGAPEPGGGPLGRPHSSGVHVVDGISADAPVPQEAGVLRASDAVSWPGYAAAMTASFGGIPEGGAIRFDPAAAFDVDGSLPRPFEIRAIHFFVEPGSSTGTLRVSINEDNGGQKPDTDRALFSRAVSSGPGENVVDLVALGTPVTIDPPRMFHVTFRGQGQAGAPSVAADDGLPYVGGSGDFHTSVSYTDPNCNVAVFGFAPPDDAAGTHSSNLMVWLDVDYLAPAPSPLFVRSPSMAGCSRCAWGDIDGDGDPDGLDTGARVWLNEGAGAFREVTSAALPRGQRGLGGGLFADFDRDGDLDYFGQTAHCWRCPTDDPIPRGAKVYDTIMRNVGDRDGDGVVEFEDVRVVDHANADDAPLPGDPDPTEGAAVGDFNNDGFIDVYLANHNDWTTYDAFRDGFWMNDGAPSFTFTDATVASGVGAALLHGRGVATADYDADGDEDIFVSNYVLDPDLLWENRGVDADDIPQFTDVGIARGVAGTQRLGAYGHGIGAAWGDVDRDGNLDLLVGNLAHSAWLCFSDTTKLYISRGASGGHAFDDIRPASGIAYNEVHSDASLADFDNDGDLDVVITHVYDGWRTSVYENLGTTPPTFRDVFASAGIGQRAAWGSAWADVDGDGDLDAWMAGGLYLNQTVERGSPNAWLEIRLHAGVSNPQSIGARVTVVAGGATQVSEVFGARGTSSQDDYVRHFGLGAASVVDRLHVRWPSGCELELTNVAPNRVVDVAEPTCLVPRFRLANEPRPAGRPRRMGCASETLTFLDDSAGSPTSWAWDLDGDTSVDATTPTTSRLYPSAGTFQVSLTVDDGTGPRTVTRPVRIDAPPGAPASGSVIEPGGNFCVAELLVTWGDADWGAAGSGVYNVYRGVTEADALSRPPLALGLTTTTYSDRTTRPGIAYVYVVEAEDSRRPGACERGPDHGGNVARLVLDTGVKDRVQVPELLAVRVRDADPCEANGITIEWDPAVFFGRTGSGTYHVYRVDAAAGRCPVPFVLGQSTDDPPLVTGLTTTTFTDATALPGVAYRYLVQAEDATANACVRGPRNGGPSASECAEASLADASGSPGSADPGNVLRLARATTDVALDWSATTVTLQAGESWGVLWSAAVRGPWTLLDPGRLAVPQATDAGAAAATFRCYRATVLSAEGCPAPDPFQP